MERITIELTEDQAELFRQFMKAYDNLKVLFESGVFEIRGGSAILNFDSQGILMNVKRNDTIYQRVNGAKS